MNLAALRALLDGDVENFKAASTPGGIEAQERAGQVTFVANETLPILGRCREQLEAMGIEFGEPVDDLFIEAKLPDGWQKVATSHSMHSDLLDDQGRKRASIFYKAAFYDRRADISICRRFSYGGMPVGGHDSPDYAYDTTPIYGAATDQGAIIWHTDKTIARPANEADRSDHLAFCDQQDELEKQAGAWLDEHYPDWNDPLAYWD